MLSKNKLLILGGKQYNLSCCGLHKASSTLKFALSNLLLTSFLSFLGRIGEKQTFRASCRPIFRRGRFKKSSHIDSQLKF